ncbi:hypothetical protein M0811_09211 [Anaeramoeba ignava]|uniref:Uncharacterized protein n=1 Tax=Anaeramoeba ignava TaxID=1746090 RepID=A0A9Q0LHM7_ANAIG|nr:hypothetical protein M0811_09211 [Anaeramoeba ignava]
MKIQIKLHSNQSLSRKKQTRAIEKSHHLYKQISSYIYSSFFPSTPSLLPSFEIKKISQNTDSTGWLNYISWKKKNAKIYYFQHKKLYQLPLGNQIDDRINECYLFSGNRFENFQKIPNLFPFHFDQFHHLNFDTIKHFFENFSIAHKYATFNPKTNLYSLFLYRVCLKKNNHYYQYYVFDSNQFFPEFEIEYSIYK